MLTVFMDYVLVPAPRAALAAGTSTGKATSEHDSSEYESDSHDESSVGTNDVYLATLQKQYDEESAIRDVAGMKMKAIKELIRQKSSSSLRK
jgi:hypothetical protein